MFLVGENCESSCPSLVKLKTDFVDSSPDLYIAADLNMQSRGFIAFHIKTLLSFDFREPITNVRNSCLAEVTKSLSGI